jgi:hypothetical protein
MNDGIPSSFTASVDRPFDPIGIRDLDAQLFNRDNQRLTDAQVEELVQNPPSASTNNRLEAMNAQANDSTNFGNQKIYNMGFREVAIRLTNTIHDILDDLVNFNRADGIRGLLSIFTQSDRLMYLGLMVVVITIGMMLFRTSDAVPTVPIRGGGCCYHNH